MIILAEALNSKAICSFIGKSPRPLFSSLARTSGSARGGVVLAVLAIQGASPAIAQYAPPKQITASPTGVDLTSGHFTTEVVDLVIGPFTLKRSYIGGHTIDGSAYFGPNWTHNYVDFVSEGDPGVSGQTKVVLYRSQVKFSRSEPTGGTVYYSGSPEAFGTSLQVSGGALIYTDKEGTVYTFNPTVNAFAPYPGRRNQRVARIDRTDGLSLVYTYDSSGRLLRIASNRGYSLVFEYGSNGYVSKACGYNEAVAAVPSSPTCATSTLSVSYSYGAAANIANVTDVRGQNWGYDYVDNGNLSALSCVRLVNTSSCKITNTYAGTKPATVSQQTLADGGVWNYDYDWPDKSQDDPRNAGEPPATSAASYSGPAGFSAVANFAGGLMGSYVANGKTTILTWNGVQLESLAYPEGNKVTYHYDAHGNIDAETWAPKAGSSVSSAVRTSTFPAYGTSEGCPGVPRSVCNRPTSTTDYNGNVTDYTYDGTNGLVLTESAPANSAGVRAVRRFGYAQRYAWIKSSGAGYVQSASPIWLLSSEKTCRLSATASNSCTAGSADEVTTDYEYGPDSGPNTLELRGKVVTADGVSLRTCYGYDTLGRRISETSPRAGFTVCP